MVICRNCDNKLNRKGPCICPECGYIMIEQKRVKRVEKPEIRGDTIDGDQ